MAGDSGLPSQPWVLENGRLRDTLFGLGRVFEADGGQSLDHRIYIDAHDGGQLPEVGNSSNVGSGKRSRSGSARARAFEDVG